MEDEKEAEKEKAVSKVLDLLELSLLITVRALLPLVEFYMAAGGRHRTQSSEKAEGK